MVIVKEKSRANRPVSRTYLYRNNCSAKTFGIHSYPDRGTIFSRRINCGINNLVLFK